MSSQARSRSGEGSLLRGWLLTAIYPVQITISKLGQGIAKVWFGYIYLVGAQAENALLHQENDRLKQELTRLSEELSATRRSQLLAEVQKLLPYKSVAAKVIARDGSYWFNRVTLDKGSTAGLKLNQPVITPGGVVGRIVKIGPLAAQVQLITDQYAGIGAQLSLSRAYGEVKGLGKNTCEMRHISGLEKVEVGEAIITSGLDGIYPKGLLIGYVEQLTPGGGAQNHQISVRPSAGLDRLEEVLVLQIEPPQIELTESVR
ncbi:MAG: rod shape-determining protein MreC [Acidobacteriota bacterium]|nr:rod shape-determining protein MreC [Blastocatellia bacterium]MDW8411410.1 rod shape-determining protein MreC [Acidobacteriota bacterium]